jgi:hypothetical protein
MMIARMPAACHLAVTSARVTCRMSTRPVLAALAVLAAHGCGPVPVAGPRPPAQPRLVALIVIDQLPYWSFAEKRREATGGIARALREGRLYVGEHPSVAVITASSHAVLGTGAPPRVHGILANEWWRRDLGRELAAVDAPAGGYTTAALRVPGIADALAVGSPRAGAVAVALKARAALLPLGQAAGTPIWYDATRPGWATRGARPRWLDALERHAPVTPRIATPWQPRDAAWLARVAGIPDDAPGEIGTHGMDGTFPHAIDTAPEPARAVVATPLGNTLVVEGAIAALAGEMLGADAVPDFISVSFSAHDYVGHAWGQESWEAWDVWARLDADLERLFAAFDRAAGPGGWAAIVTSDHGAVPMPERSGQGSRHSYAEVETIAEAAAAGVLGPGDWIAAVRYPNLYLGAVPADRTGAVIDAIVAALRAVPWLADVERTDRYAGDCAALAAAARRWCLAVDPGTSGEVVFGPAHMVVLHESDEVTAAHHGSGYPYDLEVPLILIRPGLAPGAEDTRVSMLRVAPTLTHWLGVPAPAGAREPPL